MCIYQNVQKIKIIKTVKKVLKGSNGFITAVSGFNKIVS